MQIFQGSFTRVATVQKGEEEEREEEEEEEEEEKDIKSRQKTDKLGESKVKAIETIGS